MDCSSCLELEQFIGEFCCSGDLAPEDALELDELLHRARPGYVKLQWQLVLVRRLCVEAVENWLRNVSFGGS
jgi:hypothetical protein